MADLVQEEFVYEMDAPDDESEGDDEEYGEDDVQKDHNRRIQESESR